MATKKNRSKGFKKSQQPITVAKTTNRSEPQIRLHRVNSILQGDIKTNIGLFLLFVVGTVLLYSGDLHLGFFSVDDEGYVLKNPWIKSINAENLIYIFTKPYFLNYSPLHLFSYMIDYSINGADPYIFHLSSNIWAGIVAGFVFLVALALTGRYMIAIPAAVLFVVHPAHVEAVAWISSRKDLVAAAFALPSLLAYLKYRKGGTSSRKWYIISIVLFVMALIGKVSVATFPAVFLLIDLLIEKRHFKNSLIDKVPYIVFTLLIASVVYFAQPLSGNNPSPYVFSIAFLQSFWLLIGFGEYVIYRLRPEYTNAIMGLLAIVVFLVVLVAPFFLRKKIPLAIVLFYWIVLGLLPAQLLSFVHPVSDRYLFFPSVGLVILLCLGVVTLLERFVSKRALPAIGLFSLLAFFWAWNTLGYLSEWNHPLSVWHSAKGKSMDPDVPYSLGGHYVDIAGRMGANPRGTRIAKDSSQPIAAALWAADPRLQVLNTEWERGQKNGPMEREFQNHLWTQAWNNFEEALVNKGIHVFPNLFYKRGLLLMDKGDLKGAKNEFLLSLNEASLSTVKEIREELTVSSQNALGAIAWREGNYQEALKWFKTGEQEQQGYSMQYVPDISAKRAQMETMVALQSGDIAGKSIDATAAYNLGIFYIDAASQLGSTPRVKFSLEASERIANEVWKTNPQLETLKSEWGRGIHGSSIENNFKNHLRDLAWKALEQSHNFKGNAIMPNLYFRRGMLLGESGNLQQSKKEFLLALEEAKKETNQSIKNEIIVLSHDALGVLAWTARNYKEAFQWFRLAEEEQKQFGGNWIPDIENKRQQMEKLSNGN